jgi:hypothetical protein
VLDNAAAAAAADFGLAVNHLMERPVTRLGTLDYMAPEVSFSWCLCWFNILYILGEQQRLGTLDYMAPEVKFVWFFESVRQSVHSNASNGAASHSTTWPPEVSFICCYDCMRFSVRSNANIGASAHSTAWFLRGGNHHAVPWLLESCHKQHRQCRALACAAH